MKVGKIQLGGKMCVQMLKEADWGLSFTRHPLCGKQKRCLIIMGDIHLGLSVYPHETLSVRPHEAWGTKETDKNMKLMLLTVPRIAKSFASDPDILCHPAAYTKP